MEGVDHGNPEDSVRGRHGKVGDSRSDTRTVPPSVFPSLVPPSPHPFVWDLTVAESPLVHLVGKATEGS
ncbi:hypothetical protein EAG_15082 [Camponotus floridanus]|uniref:Uncharacterized protein n=1 Tax=Camponotus floridanus TaxID=104421 RepID=E2AGY5_CAMFO|nr:hypothetical protein EAG_15082 [Camponotus floridanus]